ncbi:hypothetical protein CR513_49042, partial [Mucuna pruriens]
MTSKYIFHQTSCAHTSQQNHTSQQKGVIELKNWHLSDTIRTFLHNHVLPQFWGRYCLKNLLSHQSHAFFYLRLSASSLDLFFFKYTSSSTFLGVSGSTYFVYNLYPGFDKFSVLSLKTPSTYNPLCLFLLLQAKLYPTQNDNKQCLTRCVPFKVVVPEN